MYIRPVSGCSRPGHSTAATFIRDAMGALSSLTSLDDALWHLLEGLQAVPDREQPIDQALGRISAGLTAPGPLPVKAVAMIDGWAVRSLDIVCASSYSPVALIAPPAWVECGQSLPDGCDSVSEPLSLEQQGGLFQIVAEVRPGQGVRRAGDEIAAGSPVIKSGQTIRPLDLLIATGLGLRSLPVRLPRLRLIKFASEDGQSPTAQYIAHLADRAGAAVTRVDAARTASAIASVLNVEDAELILTVGGTGAGKTDATVDALQGAGVLVAHGIAMLPGRSVAFDCDAAHRAKDCVRAGHRRCCPADARSRCVAAAVCRGVAVAGACARRCMDAGAGQQRGISRWRALSRFSARRGHIRYNDSCGTRYSRGALIRNSF